MRTSKHYSPSECEWIQKNYLKMDWRQLEHAFEQEFGYCRCGKTIRRKGYNMGCRKIDKGINSSWTNPDRGTSARINKAGGLINYILKGNV